MKALHNYAEWLNMRSRSLSRLLSSLTTVLSGGEYKQWMCASTKNRRCFHYSRPDELQWWYNPKTPSRRYKTAVAAWHAKNNNPTTFPPSPLTVEVVNNFWAKWDGTCFLLSVTLRWWWHRGQRLISPIGLSWIDRHFLSTTWLLKPSASASFRYIFQTTDAASQTLEFLLL